MHRRHITERVRDAVHQFGPTAVAIVRLLVDLWWRGGRGV
jgi:hypothetical protein